MTRLGFAGRTLLGFVTYYFGWWSCTLGASYGYAWVGPATLPFWVALNLYHSPTPRGEALFVLVMTLFGFAMDTALVQLGVFTSKPELDVAAPWMVAVWILLALTFEGMLLLRPRKLLLFVFGAISGPLCYFPGEALGIFAYARPLWLSALGHGLLWGLLMMFIFRVRDACVRATLGADRPHA